MSYFHKVSASAGLVTGLAERLGIDLATLAQRSQTDARSYADMVTRCAHCKQQDACASLQENNPALDAAPDYCRNKDVMRRP